MQFLIPLVCCYLGQRPLLKKPSEKNHDLFWRIFTQLYNYYHYLFEKKSLKQHLYLNLKGEKSQSIFFINRQNHIDAGKIKIIIFKYEILIRSIKKE